MVGKMLKIQTTIALSVFSIFIFSSSAFADDLAKGKAVYDGAGACASCHGALGLGDGPAAAALNPKPRSFAEGVYSIDTDGDGKPGTETDLYNVIKFGAAKYGKSPMMVGRADIADEDLKALVKYVLSLKK